MRILRSKYKARDDWLRANVPKNASPIWKAIEKAKSIVSKGACYLIGDGNPVDIWFDPWVPWIQGFIPAPKSASIPREATKVSQLIDPDIHKWKAPLILELFKPVSAKAILFIHIQSRSQLDKFIWLSDPKGCFTIKSAYKEVFYHPPQPSNPDVEWKRLWKMKGSERIKMFLWRATVNALPIKENLCSGFEMENPYCVLCNQEAESFTYLFFPCPMAKALWFAICWGFKPDQAQLTTTADIIKLILNPHW